ncbi:MAG: NAD(P)-dependent oxidoreductase [Bacteroides sp.]|nr:NAD(P)-dependent oxidoreductase [Bacteroides sp.]
MTTKILITGASGFIGSFLVERALQEDSMEVWAGIRATSSRKYLTDKRIHFIELDLDNSGKLKGQLREFALRNGKWDYIIHCAGVTKCPDKKEFERVNFWQTAGFAELIRELDMVPRQFAFISTLSVYGPVHEKSYKPISLEDTPQPDTTYGLSKLRSEKYLESLEGFPYVFYRPTGVYGPREKDYFLMADSIKKRIDFSVGYKKQDITFVYVKDLADVVFAGIRKGVSRKAYNISDGEVYDSRDFSRLIRKELGIKHVLHIKAPLVILKIVSLCAGYLASLSGKSSTLNSDKYKIMKQRNWRCNISAAVNELGYCPQYNLERGVKETITWYKQEGWL